MWLTRGTRTARSHPLASVLRLANENAPTIESGKGDMEATRARVTAVVAAIDIPVNSS